MENFDEIQQIANQITGETQEGQEQTAENNTEGTSVEAQALSEVSAEEKTVQTPSTPQEQPDTDDFKTTFGEKYKTAKELQEYVQSLESSKSEFETKFKPYETVSEFVKGLVEFEAKGGNPLLYAQVQALDFEKMSPKEVIKYKYMIDNTDLVAKLGQEKMDRYFEKEFATKYGDPDIDDEDDMEIKNILLDRDKAEAQKFLNGQKKALLTPPQTQQAELTEAYLKDVDKALKDFNKLEFNVGDKKFNFALPDKAQIEDIMRKPESLLDLFVDETGKDNIEGFRNAVGMVLNAQKIVKSAYEQGKNDGLEAHIKTLKNPQTLTKTTAPNTKANLSETEQMVEAIMRGKN